MYSLSLPFSFIPLAQDTGEGALNYCLNSSFSLATAYLRPALGALTEDSAARLEPGTLIDAKVPLSVSPFKPVMGEALREFVKTLYHVGAFFKFQTHRVDFEPFFAEGADCLAAHAAFAERLKLTGNVVRVITIVGNGSAPTTKAATAVAAAGHGQPRAVIPPGWCALWFCVDACCSHNCVCAFFLLT